MENNEWIPDMTTLSLVPEATACEVQMCKGTMLDESLSVLQSRAAMY